MIRAIVRWMTVVPDVGRPHLPERPLALVAAGSDDKRNFIDRRRAAAALAHEPRILGVGDGLDAEKEVVDVHPMHGTFVILRVFGSHQKFARRNERELGRGIRRHR